MGFWLVFHERTFSIKAFNFILELFLDTQKLKRFDDTRYVNMKIRLYLLRGMTDKNFNKIELYLHSDNPEIR